MANGLGRTTLGGQCSVCGSTDVVSLIEIRQIPVHCNMLWPTQEGALHAPRGDLRLGLCGECGHIFNLAFDPALMEYTQAYENSLHFSPHFQRYAESLVAQLVERYDLHGKDIIEIGCGKGEFLTLLCELGGNRGIGFDPSYIPEQNASAKTSPITVIRDFYSERFASYTADFICCRHVLEHIQFPRDFLSSVRCSIGGRLKTVVFFEVPNALFTLRDLGIWDLIYEHCSYFSARSLSRLFMSCGFDVLNVSEAFGGQFLCAEAVPTKNPAHPDHSGNGLDTPTSEAGVFADRYRRKVRVWAEHLEQMTRQGRRAVVWGAGSKGVTFLNTLRIYSQIEYVVDLNPRKQGRYVAGTGQKIVAPEFLRSYRPEVVLVMNSIYQSEIQHMTERLGLTPELICV